MIELNLQTGNNKTFLIDGKTERTYKDLQININKMYEALLVKLSSEVIIVQIIDRFQLAYTIFALGQLGSTFLLINPKWSKSEIELVLNNTMAKQIITDNIDLLPLKEFGVDVLLVKDLLLAEVTQTSPNPIRLTGEVLMCTTGTTDEPKIVARTWEAIFSEVDAVIERLHYSEFDRIFCLAQWTHSLGFVLHLLSGIRVGARLITVPTLCTPSSWIQVMKREEVTIVVGVPTFYSFLIQAPAINLKIKMGISAGAALPRDIYENFKAKFYAPLLQFYGCTEAGAITMQSPENEAPYPSVGKHLENIQIRIVDEQGVPVNRGEIGFIRIKGKGMAHRMLHKGKFIPMDNEYETGDQGMLTEADTLIIMGRNKQRIKINGLSLHPGEIEKVLQQHPKIIEAVVIAENNERRGNSLVAYLRIEDNPPNELEIRTFCQERLAPYKIPHQYIFVKEFERDEKGQVKL